MGKRKPKVATPAGYYPAELAAIKDVTVQTIRLWIKQGKLVGRWVQKPSGGWCYWIPIESVQAFDAARVPSTGGRIVTYRKRKEGARAK